ncbi:hypothetical protein [Bradymonas sediminis]|nr:hypothetical protein [Bradymonas sediminis]
MTARPYKLALGAALLLLALSGCTAVQRISEPRRASSGYLRLEVEPADTLIYIDADYQGRVDGWAANTVLVKPGLRQVELRADGYITRRFDIEVAAGEQSFLKVSMEAELERLDGDLPDESAAAAPSPPGRGDAARSGALRIRP